MSSLSSQEKWQAELRDAQTILMTLGYSVIDILPDIISNMLPALTEPQVFDLASNLYESCQARKDPVTNTALLFPFGKDVVVASYLQQYESETSDGADLAAEADDSNACARATNLLEFLEKQKRLDKSGPFGNKDEQCVGDIQPGLQGLRQVVIAWAFGCPSPLDARVVDEARPHIRNNDEVSCNKLLSKLAVGKHGAASAFALSLLGSCGLAKSLFLRRFKAAHEQTPTNMYRALFQCGILGPEFFTGESDIISATRVYTKGITPLLYYANLLEHKILGDC
jgi:hypothetical protein